MNQDIALVEIYEFYTKLRVKDVNQRFNYIRVKDLSKTHRRGSKCIDSIVASPNIFECIEGSKLLEINEVLDTDYRLYLIDINLEYYIEEKFVYWDK